MDCDAVVLAVGAVSAGRLVVTCPALAPWKEEWQQLRGVTRVAVRLFLDTVLLDWPTLAARTIVMKESPVVVCGPNLLHQPPNRRRYADSLIETGFCLYDLSRLQDEFIASASELAVLEVDFFRADALADCNDATVVVVTLQAVTAALEEAVDPIQLSRVILDQSVVRARRAVSHFCPGSASVSPPVKLNRGLYICGDWADRTGHSSLHFIT